VERRARLVALDLGDPHDPGFGTVEIKTFLRDPLEYGALLA